MATKRASFTLPPQVVDDLAYLSRRMGITRSALLAQIAGEPIHSLREIVEALPENPSEEEVRRFYGQSMGVIQARIEQVQRLAGGDDLFPPEGGNRQQE